MHSGQLRQVLDWLKFMKTIIAGSRGITKASIVNAAMEGCGWVPTEVVCGCARGVDELGADWAESRGIKVSRFPANWDEYGKRAGHIRNEAMAKYADALVAIWDGESRGTRSMIDLARRYDLKVIVYIWSVQV